MSDVSRTVKNLVVGNPDVYDEYFKALMAKKPGNTSPIVGKEPLDNTKMPVIYDKMTGIDVNNDGADDNIERRSYRIGYGTKASPYKWAVFTIINFGGDKQIKSDLVGAKIQDEEPLIDSGMELSARLMISQGNPDNHLERGVAEAAHSVMAFCYETLANFHVVRGSGRQSSEAANAERLGDDLISDLNDEFMFAVRSLETSAKTFPDNGTTGKMVRTLHSNPNALPASLADVKVAAVKKYEEAQNLWDNSKLGIQCDELYEKYLEVFQGDADRASNAREYVSVLEHQRQEGGFFYEGEGGFISEANRLALENGYDNYAESEVLALHEITVGEYKAMMEKFLASNKMKIRQAIEDKQGKNWNGAITDDNIYGLFVKKLDKKPDISASEAWEVVKRFYNDLGIDLDNLPYGGKIHKDIYYRNDKDADGYSMDISDGRSGLVVVNFDEDNRSTLPEVANLIHEVGHFVHSHLRSGSAGGDILASYLSSTSWNETFACAMENTVGTPEFAERYLASYEAFSDPNIRSIAVNNSAHQSVWWSSVMALRGLWEINLYEDYSESRRYRPMEERLDYWNDLGIKYIGLADLGVPVASHNVYYGHPMKNPLQYVAYSAGKGLQNEITDTIVAGMKEGGSEKMQDAFANVHRLLESETIYSLEDAVTAWDEIQSK